MSSVETVTILITDLVGSTELAARVGPAAADELRRAHFSLLRQAIEEGDGREVKNMGDGVMASFQSAAAAMSCAVSIQQRMDWRNQGAGEQLLVRIGISAGDVTVDENEYFGMPVVEAVRLCDRATGGQILTSDLLRTIARTDTHTFKEVGALELKGIPEPVRSFEVVWDHVHGTGSTLPLPSRLHGVSPTGFVGRKAERAKLRAMADEAAKGQLRVALISGEPGIGKTRLAVHVGLQAHASGTAVLFGRCQEELRVPYQLWAEALRHCVEHAPDDALRRHVERSGGEVARLAPNLLRRLPDAPPPRQTDPETERYLLWTAIEGLLEEVSSQTPAVLILDDLHWADKPTLTLLKRLAVSDPPMALLVIGTYRESELTRGEALTELLADLRRESCVERIALDGLEEADVVTLMDAVGHEVDETGVALAREITRETDGNPYFVIELMRHLGESPATRQRRDGRWSFSGSIADLGLPRSVREVIGRRVERLGSAAVQALQAAAVVGRDFDIELLGRVLGRESGELLQILEQAVDASLLHESRQVPGQFSFAHALVNQTIYESLGVTRRAHVHRHVGEALEELFGEDGDHVRELAHHWSKATVPVEADKAVAYARRAGEHALADLAPDEALRWFGRALDLLGQHAAPDSAERCDVLIGYGTAERQVGRPEFRETLLEAARLAHELGDGDRLARATLNNTRGFASIIGQVDADRVAVLEQALALANRPSTRAELMSLLAVELLYGSDLERRLELSDEAVHLARQTGDAAALGWVLARRFIAVMAPETNDQLLEDMDELVALANELEDPVLQFWGATWRACAAVTAADIDEFERCVERMQEVVQLTRQPVLSWVTMFARVWRALTAGYIEEAEKLAHRAMAVAGDTGQPDVIPYFIGSLFAIRYAQGRLAELESAALRIATENPGIPGLASTLSLSYCELDRLTDAQQILDRCGRSRFTDVPRDISRLNTLANFAEAAAQTGDREAAAALYEQLSPWSGRITFTGVRSSGAVDLYLGRLAATLGRHDQAEHHFASAAQLHERIDAPIWLAYTRYGWALSLYERGNPGDAERARSLGGQALAMARALGLGNLERRASAMLEAVAAR
jgi:class 3 adenylate cyclase/tetratricopeptide (TPR) repeat protein